MTRILALLPLLALAACGDAKPIIEAPRPVIQRVVVDPSPVPKRLRQCSAQPTLLGEDSAQGALPPAYVDERAAGQDCREKLRAVDDILTRAGR